MIEKFVSIKNIGRFHDYTPSGDVSFRKLTLLFAENGRGKTTLCAILRSLRSGEPSFITERKTLGSVNPASITLRLCGSTYTFANNVWSATYANIVIFDSVFIHDNVYSGDYIEHEHKKNLYRVIIGDTGVTLAHQIEKLDSDIREANSSIRTKKEAVNGLLPRGVRIEDFLAWQQLSDVDATIEHTTTEIASQERAAAKADDIRTKELLGTITLPTLPDDFQTILETQLADIALDAGRHVHEQIAKHGMAEEGEAWLSQGIAFVVDDTCPFCGQSLKENVLIAAYRSQFNTEYNDLKAKVTQLTGRINDVIGESALNSIQQTYSKNLALIEFWKQFVKITVREIDFTDIRAKYTALRDEAIALAQRKQQLPVEPVSVGDALTTATAALTALRQLATAYNAEVDAANTLIQTQKTATQHGQELTTLKESLAGLEGNKQRFTPDGVKACDEYSAALAAKAALERQKETLKEQLDQYCEQILRNYEDSINQYLDQFSAGFRIANSRHVYTGGTPSSHYQIVINKKPVDLGDSRTSPGTPCFRTTLSSGDRSALALAFFLAVLKHDQFIANKLVVLDDPFTSQDRFRRTCTQQLICVLANSAEQVVVLSHDPRFLNSVYDDYPSANAKALQLRMIANSTAIAEWDIKADIQPTYLTNYSTLLNFYRDRKGKPLDVARSIRPFLEGLYRSHFPGHFGASEWLGDFIGKVRQSTSTDGLDHAKSDLSELEAINNYSKKYHHDQNPNADTEPISEDELYGFVKRTLRFVGAA